MSESILLEEKKY